MGLLSDLFKKNTTTRARKMINHICQNGFIILDGNSKKPAFLLELLLFTFDKVYDNYTNKYTFNTTNFFNEYFDEIKLYSEENGLDKKLEGKLDMFMLKRFKLYEAEMKVLFSGTNLLPGRMAYCFYDAPLTSSPELSKQIHLIVQLPEKIRRLHKRIDNAMFLVDPI
jgi:hypothetical protein